jgi:hypothetical protein
MKNGEINQVGHTSNSQNAIVLTVVIGTDACSATNFHHQIDS